MLGSLGLLLLWLGSVSAAGLPLAQIETIFTFGDSYSASANPPITTLLNSTWAVYLANEIPGVQVLSFAQGGAIVDDRLTADIGAPSFVEQVALFRNARGVAWAPDTSLFEIWFGINDVGFNYIAGVPYPSVAAAIMASYRLQIRTLYALGARHFLLIGIPPLDRTPLVVELGEEAVSTFARDVAIWNDALRLFVLEFPRLFAGSSVILFDTRPLFNTILDNPFIYGFQNSTGACPEYILATNVGISLPDCIVPLAEYFWYNGYHPTPAIHQLLAQGIKSTMLTISTDVLPVPPPIVSPSATLTIPAVPRPTNGGPSPTGTARSSSSRNSVGLAVGLLVGLGWMGML